jgi:hypothetical protein
MTAIDRTAYPRPGERHTPEELDTRYRLSETAHAFIRATARGDAGHLTLATLLKGRQDLGCFPAPIDMHGNTVRHLASQLGLADPFALITEEAGAKTLYRYRAAVRTYLNASPYAEAGEQLVAATVLEAATTMSDPAHQRPCHRRHFARSMAPTASSLSAELAPTPKPHRIAPAFLRGMYARTQDPDLPQSHVVGVGQRSARAQRLH